MTTISTYYCSICEAVKSIATSTLDYLWSIGESAGRARAASHLSQMGMHDEAKALMLGDRK
jgi:hypothetical protein|tara:strand:+ start:175 stop:357 length:183 start_codon:yes stop_codon:yes gene_type:complete